jgi:dimethylallyldiphosphate transferase
MVRRALSNAKDLSAVAYYGKPDLEIAEGMDIFFKSQGWNKSFHSYKENYVNAL